MCSLLPMPGPIGMHLTIHPHRWGNPFSCVPARSGWSPNPRWHSTPWACSRCASILSCPCGVVGVTCVHLDWRLRPSFMHLGCEAGCALLHLWVAPAMDVTGCSRLAWHALRLFYGDAWPPGCGCTSFSGCSIHFTLPKQCGAGEVDLHDGRLKSGFSWNITSQPIAMPVHNRLALWANTVCAQYRSDGFCQPIQKRWAASISSLPLCVFLLDLRSFSGVFSRGVRGWHSTFCRLVGGVNSVSGVAMHLVGPIRCSCGTSGMELARSCDGFVYAMPLAGLPPCLLIHLAPFSQGW